MDTNNQIMILRAEVDTLLLKAEKLLNNEDYVASCATYKQAISKALLCVHATESAVDHEKLNYSYKQIVKYYFNVYATTKAKTDIFPANLYLEKLVANLEDHLDKKSATSLKEILEALLKLVWVSFELDNFKFIKQNLKKLKDLSKCLIRIDQTFENEQYLILTYIFKGDFAFIKNHYLIAFAYYYYAEKKLAKVFDELKTEGVKQDLMGLEDKVIQTLLILKLYRLRKKYMDKKDSLKAIKIEKEE